MPATSAISQKLLMNIPKTPIIGCIWEDAHGSDGTLSAHEIDHKPYIYTTVGFLVRSDDMGVSIASEEGEDGKYRDITFVPRKMVVREYPISPKSLRRQKRAPNSTPAKPVPQSPTDS